MSAVVLSTKSFPLQVTDLGQVLHMVGGTAASYMIFFLPGMLLLNAAIVKRTASMVDLEAADVSSCPRLPGTRHVTLRSSPRTLRRQAMSGIAWSLIIQVAYGVHVLSRAQWDHMRKRAKGLKRDIMLDGEAKCVCVRSMAGRADHRTMAATRRLIRTRSWARPWLPAATSRASSAWASSTPRARAGGLA